MPKFDVSYEDGTILTFDQESAPDSKQILSSYNLYKKQKNIEDAQKYLLDREGVPLENSSLLKPITKRIIDNVFNPAKAQLTAAEMLFHAPLGAIQATGEKIIPRKELQPKEPLVKHIVRGVVDPGSTRSIGTQLGQRFPVLNKAALPLPDVSRAAVGGPLLQAVMPKKITAAETLGFAIETTIGGYSLGVNPSKIIKPREMVETPYGMVPKGGMVHAEWIKPTKQTGPIPETGMEPQVPEVSLELLKKMTASYQKDFSKIWPVNQLSLESKNAVTQVVEAAQKGYIQIEEIPRILQKTGLTLEEFYNTIGPQISKYGKGLQLWRSVLPRLEKITPQELLERYNLGQKPIYPFEAAKTAYKNISGVSKAGLISNLSTATGNLASMGGTYWLFKIPKDIIIGGQRMAFGGERPAAAFAEAAEDVLALGRFFNPSKRKEFLQFLDSFPTQKAVMMTNVMQDVNMGHKMSRYIAGLTFFAESFGRRVVADATISGHLRRAAKLGKEITPVELNEIVKKGANESLIYTLAAWPETKVGQAILKAYEAFPPLDRLGAMFPKVFINAWELTLKNMPLKIFHPEVRGLMNPNTERGRELIAEAAVGGMLMGAALGIRSSAIGGEKYYEINMGKNEVLDASKYIPMVNYLFIAELMLHPWRLSKTDITRAASSMNRVGGYGLPLLDAFVNQSEDNTRKIGEELTGQFLAGFTTPLNMVKNLAYDPVSEESRTVRTIKLNPILDPAITKIPGLSKTLKPTASVIRGTPEKITHPVLQQVTSLRLVKKAPIQREVDRLGIQLSGFSPKTGNPELDYKIIKQTGLIMEKELDKILSTKAYKQLPDSLKKELLERTIRDTESNIHKNPDLAVEGIVHRSLTKVKKYRSILQARLNR